MRTWFVKLTLALILTSVASAEIVAQQNADLVGSYLVRHQWGGAEITLNRNGTFYVRLGWLHECINFLWSIFSLKQCVTVDDG